MTVPLTKPDFGVAEEQAVAEVLRLGWVVQGPKVAQFEAAIAAYAEAKHAVATSSCTTALQLILTALRVGPGDEVIVPAFTFIASANAVEYVGATPVFVDVDPRTYNLEVRGIEERITARTKAIMPVHLFGLAADMEPILALARKSGLAVVEDAACATGTRYRGKRVGALGTAGAFSYHPRKVITTGEGGAVMTNDGALAEHVRVLRNHGARRSDLEQHKADAFTLPEYDELGFNYRMTDLQAALGVVQMAKADRLIGDRRTLAERYTNALAGVPGLDTPFVPDGCEHAYQSYVLRIEGGAKTRDEVAVALTKDGISVRHGTHAVHALGYYRRKYDLKESDFPESWRADRSSLTLPLYSTMDHATQDRVIDALHKLLRS
ncbi:MAG TPA: DegT/DnrJ/EryC1/StrS aminotransferase family protein [Vicinamibacterales bacterium]|nr:DegT/DnrJ/EryC1/StrS aminotransferase family protein [Vicinamibacterales bacterium]